MEANEDAHLKHCVRGDWVDDTPFDAVTHKVAFSMGGGWKGGGDRPIVPASSQTIPVCKTQGGVVTACVP